MSGHEQGWGQNCTEIAPATPHTNGLSALLRLATYATVDQDLSITGPYKSLQALLGRIPMRYMHLRAEDLVGKLG